MEKLLTLTPKHWLTGLSSGAHIASAALYQAAGVTPLYDAGGTESAENGLLQAGASPTDFTSSVVVDSIIASVSTSFSGTAQLYLLGSSGHFYKKAVGAGMPTDLRSGTPITNPFGGMTVWGPANGTTLLYYWNNGNIGTWNMSGVYPTGWTDNVYTSSSAYLNTPVHKFEGNIYYGGNGGIGSITDNGAGAATHTATTLKVEPNTLITSICDDGIYLAFAMTSNLGGENMFAGNQVRFWDLHSPSWSREYEIRDPFIWAMKNVGNVVYAFGKLGIYEVTFGGGVRKVYSGSIAALSTLTSQSSSGKATIYNNSALLFSNTTTIDTYGKLQPDVPISHLKPFSIPSGTPTHVTASLDAGRVYVATDTPKLYGFDFNGATRGIGVIAKTIYFPLPTKTNVERIDIVFGEPLASGDTITVGAFADEDTAVTSFGTVSYDATKTTRRKSLFKSITVEDQLAIQLTFTAGAVKVKNIEIYGTQMKP